MPTLDEVLGRVTNPEDREFLKKMIADQNSYITKLENVNKGAAQQGAQPAPSQATSTGVDKITQNYILQKMKADVIIDATGKIKQAISEPMFEAVKDDWIKFLDANMSVEKTTVEFAVDAFNLILGRCLSIKDHAVNQLGKAQPPAGTPNAGVQSPTNAGTNAAGVQGVNDILRNQPPTMGAGDVGAQSGMPNVPPTQIKNTKDAFSSLKNKLSGNGGNKFQ